MKKVSFLALAAAGMLLSACTDSDVADSGGNDVLEGSASYFTINLNLPSTPATSTRAWDEDETGTLHDGLNAEWAVNDVTLLIYEGESEADAVLKQVVAPTPVKGPDDFSDTPNQITATSGKYLTKIENAPSSNLYVLAVVNGGSVIAFKNATTVTVKGTDVTAGSKLSAINAQLAASASVSANDFVWTSGSDTYFFMTNAVLSTVQGGTTEPSADPMLQTLAPVDASKIFKTEADASASDAAAVDIYVERGAVKVTLAEQSGKFLNVDKLSKTDDAPAISATFAGWSLDNTNNTAYPIRTVPATDATKTAATNFEWNMVSAGTSAATDKYRFIGGNLVKTGAGLYRTYWAQDPNYNTAPDAANFSSANDVTGTTTFITSYKDGSNEVPLYCLENTFTVDQQITSNTTCAILKIKLNSGGEDFYSVGDDRTKLYAGSDVTKMAIADLFNIPAFSNWFDTHATTPSAKLAASDVTITWDKEATVAGKRVITEIKIAGSKLTAGSDVEVSTESGLTDVISTVNAALKQVELFKGGISYYRIRIKHFGDDLTPWNSDEYESGNPTYKPHEVTAQGVSESDADYQARQIAGIYPQASDNRRATNYLGRYGVVRNNWYELSIGEILQLGSSTVPELDAHPDDALDELYINANINILSWAKRPQNWSLK